MHYILINYALHSNLSEIFSAYQEIENGTLIRYCHYDTGETLELDLCNSWVVDGNPPVPIWAQ